MKLCEKPDCQNKSLAARFFGGWPTGGFNAICWPNGRVGARDPFIEGQPVGNLQFTIGPTPFTHNATPLPGFHCSRAGSCFSSESAPRPLYGGFLVKRFKQGGASFFLRHFFVRSESPFLRPDPDFTHATRKRGVRRRTNLAACSALARPHLDGFEHDGTAGCGRDDDQRGARFRARFNRATTLYPVGPRT